MDRQYFDVARFLEIKSAALRRNERFRKINRRRFDARICSVFSPKAYPTISRIQPSIAARKCSKFCANSLWSFLHS
ncbi:hypothetical protein Taro_044152 [Colocasia esculenta]|uniref:Uncharacterized protein n=1 Tax=Colocasia esculenta TaxID=4460 RepID=A0A843WXK7_COLES|nr:hypothetical protein [Colocasia esculenta]